MKITGVGEVAHTPRAPYIRLWSVQMCKRSSFIYINFVINFHSSLAKIRNTMFLAIKKTRYSFSVVKGIWCCEVSSLLLLGLRFYVYIKYFIKKQT